MPVSCRGPSHVGSRLRGEGTGYRSPSGMRTGRLGVGSGPEPAAELCPQARPATCRRGCGCGKPIPAPQPVEQARQVRARPASRSSHYAARARARTSPSRAVPALGLTSPDTLPGHQNTSMQTRSLPNGKQKPAQLPSRVIAGRAKRSALTVGAAGRSTVIRADPNTWPKDHEVTKSPVRPEEQ